MKISELGIVIPGSEPHMSIQSAILAAEEAPGAMVWIPAHYVGEDTYINPNSIPIVDCRNHGYASFGATTLPNVIDGGTF